MTPTEFNAILGGLHLSPSLFALLCGADDRTGRAWASGKSRIPPGIASLARVAEGVGTRLPYPELAALLRREAQSLDAVGS